MPAWLTNLLRLIVAILMPVVLILTNVRIMLTPLYINWEYNLPNFPPDLYGFTQADRLTYSRLALDFLLNDAGIEFLGDQTLPDDKVANADQGNRMYNDRELKHMRDVKIVVKGTLNVWVIAGLLWLGAIIALAWQPQAHPILRSGLLIGGGITVGLLVVLGLYIAFGFDTFFVQFHHVFFEGDSWLFLLSDTLIRLFPVKFWQDVFLLIAGGALAEAAALAALAWWGLKAGG